jgi:hypothetical protein
VKKEFPVEEEINRIRELLEKCNKKETIWETELLSKSLEREMSLLSLRRNPKEGHVIVVPFS